MKRKTHILLAVTVFAFLCVADAHAQKGDSTAGGESFATICASCHGPTGKGDGVAAAALEPKPRDLSDAKYLSTLTDEYLFKVITEGGTVVGKAPTMPAWGGVLGEDGAWNVIAYIRKEICKCVHAE
ncbi:MAG: c-type cytochrome [Candidatus Mycalebacterium zealandia]|nr:MAG: c-type cytochrome [Candidatus Mycalebacterium zealandia]